MVKGPEDASLFQAIVEEAHDAFVVIDEAQAIVYVNRGAEQMFGYDKLELIGRPLDVLLPEPAQGKHRELVRQFGAGQEHTHHMAERSGISAVRKNGEVFPAEATIVKTETARGLRLTAILRDTTKTKALEAKLSKLVVTDPLTVLLNRRGFFDAANAELKRAERHCHPLTFLMMDLDHFKQINDRFGHAAGDQVLARIADCCRDTLRGHDIIGRLGGEEFAAVLISATLSDARRAAERLRKAVAALVIEDAGEPISLTISIGLAASQFGDMECEGVLQNADRALYAAKLAGRNCIRVAQPCLARRPAAITA